MRQFLPLLGSAALLASCSLAPRYVRPASPVPPSWPSGDAYLRNSEAALPSVTYAQVFHDRRLQAIIAQALSTNRDLRVAAANILAARAQYRIRRADLFPELAVNARYNRSGGGNNASSVAGTTTSGVGAGSGTVGAGGTGAVGGTGAGGTGTSTGGQSGSVITSSGSGSAYSVNLGLTAYQIDLFGEVRSLSTAALQRYFESEAAARATRLTLIGDIANAWFTYAGDRSLLLIAQQTRDSAELSVRLTEARVSGGIAPLTDLLQAQQILQTAQADVAQQVTLVAQDANLLQLLAGAPVASALLPASIEEVEGTVAALPSGLDSTILLRRPDVIQAEYELRATNAEIGAARAQLFPRVALTGLLGFASSELTSLFTGGAFNYSITPTASYSIFNAGAARAGVAYSRAQRDAALASYERSIQSAFREVADALARQGTIDEQLRATREFAEAARQTNVLAAAQYEGGIQTYLSSLDAQRQLYQAQQNLVQTELAFASNRVALYTALGGDGSFTVERGADLPATSTVPVESKAARDRPR